MPRAVFRTLLQLLGLGLLVGTILGWLACAVLSGGGAAPQFYLVFGIFGAVVGLVGSIIAGGIIGVMRLIDRRLTSGENLEEKGHHLASRDAEYR